MVREQEIEALAHHLIEGLIAKGAIVAKAPTEALAACVIELMSANFELDAELDEEAEKMAEAEARKSPNLDLNRLRALIKQRLAERKNFPL